MAQGTDGSCADRADLWRRILAALVILGAAMVLALLFIVDPSRRPILPPCPFYAATGLYCPGCGSARGLHQLLHGRFVAALRFNPLMVASLPVLAYAAMSEISILVRGRRLPPPNTSAKIDWAILAVILAYWALRNLPFYPFSLLSPHIR